MSFNDIFQLTAYKSYISFVRFIPKHFFLFDAIINGIVSLISFLPCSLLVYSNMVDFQILTSWTLWLIFKYRSHTLRKFINSNRCFMHYLEFSCHLLIETVSSNLDPFYLFMFFLVSCPGWSLQDNVEKQWAEQVPLISSWSWRNSFQGPLCS